MDLWNNNIGLIAGNVMFPIFTSNSSLSNDIHGKLLMGELRYLSPIEPTPILEDNGANNNFWHINGNQRLGKHGITTTTQLIPANQ